METQHNIRIEWRDLKTFCSDVLAGAELPRAEADIVADSLVHANLVGLPSHGVSRLGDYLTRLDKGLIEKKTRVEVIQESPTTALLDANNGWGQVVSEKAVGMAVDKAKEYGSVWIGVRNSNHYGTAGYWTSRLASEGMVGISCTNGSPVMAAFGSRQPSLGTNPISIAVPSRSGRPVVLDMSTSAQARGKILLAAKNKESIPEGWAITRDGLPTTDALEAWQGSILPLGGPKGSGLAIMIDILSGVLTGAQFGAQMPRMYDDPAPQNLGHFFAAIDVETMLPLEHFLSQMDEKERETRESLPAAGFDEVLMPGDLEYRKAEEHRRDGIPLTEEIHRELASTADRYGIPTDLISRAKG